MEKISRRDFARRAGMGALAATLPALATAEPQEAADLLNAEVAGAEKMLAKPLSEEARKLTKDAVRANNATSALRLRFKLTDCSEPCTIFPVTPFEGAGS
ncbi:MAG: hypothetical protein K1X67_18145 [Fimbriimonadaceae bacterium]|nr:hypothetical protein [Fimbriimonadaceae bacterium]